MYGEEHYECAHARNNPPPSGVISQFSHGSYTSRKELKSIRLSLCHMTDKNIITVVDRQVIDDSPFYVMPFTRDHLGIK